MSIVLLYSLSKQLLKQENTNLINSNRTFAINLRSLRYKSLRYVTSLYTNIKTYGSCHTHAGTCLELLGSLQLKLEQAKIRNSCLNITIVLIILYIGIFLYHPVYYRDCKSNLCTNSCKSAQSLPITMRSCKHMVQMCSHTFSTTIYG